eukprot:3229799-Rhodomonas_salina.2
MTHLPVCCVSCPPAGGPFLSHASPPELPRFFCPVFPDPPPPLNADLTETRTPGQHSWCRMGRCNEAMYGRRSLARPLCGRGTDMTRSPSKRMKSYAPQPPILRLQRRVPAPYYEYMTTS